MTTTNNPPPMTPDEIFDLAEWEEETYRPSAPADVEATARNIIAARDAQWREMLERESSWQPIETAPKDGTRVLLWEPTPTWWRERHGESGWDNHEIASWQQESASAYVRWVWLVYDENQGEHEKFVKNPTHWMPLPAPPKP